MNLFEVFFYVQAAVVLVLDLRCIIIDFANEDVNFTTALCILAFLAMAGAIVAQIMAGYPWGGILALVSWGFSIYALNRIGGNNY